MLLFVRFGFISAKTHSPPWHTERWVQMVLMTHRAATIPGYITESETRMHTSMPASNRVAGTAQVLGQVLLHLGSRLEGHRVEVFVQLRQETYTVLHDDG